MKLWNKSGKADSNSLTLAGDASAALDAIFIAAPETIFGTPAPVTAPKGPQIRERYFGAGVPRAAAGEPVAKPVRKNLLARIGFGRKADETDVEYAGTQIVRSADAPVEAVSAPEMSDDDKVLETLFGTQAAPAISQPAPTPVYRPAPKPTTKKKWDRSDITLAALGVTLGLTCAMFPWYIFYNQEQFGVREFVFEGRGSATPSRAPGYQPKLVSKPFSTGEVPKMDLDFFPTATLPDENETIRAVPASEQPFPLDIATFKLVHVANGRAMIEDADGLWIVQPGSRLPDASRVVSIEQRKGSWVLVTNSNRVIELAN